jgi:hypothetical protein
MESLVTVSDIPAGDRKIANLFFYSVKVNYLRMGKALPKMHPTAQVSSA